MSVSRYRTGRASDSRRGIRFSSEGFSGWGEGGGGPGGHDSRGEAVQLAAPPGARARCHQHLRRPYIYTPRDLLQVPSTYLILQSS